MAYLRNTWYIAAWADELAPGGILARTICGDPVALYRDMKGRVAALEDCCCHRHYPLSGSGTVVGEYLQCGYHGFQYNAAGECVSIPTQAHIPENARVRSYPAIERHRCLWIWTGDPARADPATIPDFSCLEDPAWGWRGTRYPTKANYRFIIENVINFDHLAFVHKGTIGNAPEAQEVDVKLVRGEGNLQFNRWLTNSKAPPSYHAVASFMERVDRWSLIRYISPTMFHLWAGAVPHGVNAREKIAAHGAPEGKKLGGIGYFSLHMVTPETERSSHYFWAHGQDYQPDDQATTDLVFEQTDAAFRQDWVLLERLQERSDQVPGRPRVDVNGDAGGMQVLSLLDTAIRNEQRAPQSVC